MQTQMPKFLHASERPLEDISKVSYPGQDPLRRQYRAGYEYFLNELPTILNNDQFLEEKLNWSRAIMKNLAHELNASAWIKDNDAGLKGFSRTIVALESPQYTGYTNSILKEGAELIVAKWGTGNSSPVHGHAAGFLHEEILFGKMRVNTYRLVNPTVNVVRPVSTEIVGPGTFLSKYSPPNYSNHFPRQEYIHNFTALEFSASLHYLPEHTRDGRDNGFKVEYFEDSFNFSNLNYSRIHSKEAMYMPAGEVLLVRSENVPEYGDHFIVITGAPVIKEHGLRPQDIAIGAPHTSGFLDQFPMQTGLVLLRLSPGARDAFHEFHGIKMVNRQVIFPQP